MRKAGMRYAWRLLAVLVLFAARGSAQIGKNVPVAAGTPEDKALAEIYAATDPAQKITLLDKFMVDFGKGDLAMLGDQLYATAYLDQKNYDKSLEYGEKVLALDPDNLAAAVTMVHAAEGKGDAAKLYEYGDRVTAILTRYKAAPPPEGISPEVWTQQKNENFGKAQPDIGYVQYAMFNAGYQTTDPAAKAALLERYIAAFPDSTYTSNARTALAFAYQQAQNSAKMLDAAQKVLAADPSNPQMLLLLADYWSDHGQHLDDAAGNAQKALDALDKMPKPADTSDADWQQQVGLQRGVAYSALGQVYVSKTQNAQALDFFTKASPLLKSNNYYYARNLYRLGFTQAKMKLTPEARATLTQVLALDSPFKSLAQQTLNTINGTVPAHKKRRP